MTTADHIILAKLEEVRGEKILPSDYVERRVTRADQKRFKEVGGCEWCGNTKEGPVDLFVKPLDSGPDHVFCDLHCASQFQSMLVGARYAGRETSPCTTDGCDKPATHALRENGKAARGWYDRACDEHAQGKDAVRLPDPDRDYRRQTRPRG